MTIFDNIRKDRDAGSSGKWSDITIDTIWKGGHNVMIERHPDSASSILHAMYNGVVDADIQRIARVPQLEAIALAAEELKEAIDYCDNNGVVPADICDALDKLEEACK